MEKIKVKKDVTYSGRFNRKMLTKKEADSLFKAGGTLVEKWKK